MKFNFNALVMSLTATLGLLGNQALAADVATVTTADGVGADAQIMGFGDGREELNKGGAASFEVRGHEYSGNNYYGVLKFDLSDFEPGNADTLSLTLTLSDQPAKGGKLMAFGLEDGYTGGEDNSGASELGETDFTEGEANWAKAETDDAITGDNAPGFSEKSPGLDAMAAFKSKLVPLGEVEIPADASVGQTIVITSKELAEFVKLDTNQTLVIYLATSDAFAAFATKESNQPPSLSVTAR